MPARNNACSANKTLVDTTGISPIPDMSAVFYVLVAICGGILVTYKYGGHVGA
jgi:hypothetical protein